MPPVRCSPDWTPQQRLDHRSMPDPKTGCILWTGVFTFVGYVFGKNLPLVEKYIREIGIAAAVLVVAALVIFLVRRRSQRTV